MRNFTRFLGIASFYFCTFTSTIFSEAIEQIVDAIQIVATTVQSKMETDIFNRINQYRQANFLPALTLSPIVSQQARAHSVNMASGIMPFGHQGVNERFLVIRQQIPSTIRFGENVAYNRGAANPVETAVAGWLNSPSHWANIMGDYNRTGVGVALNVRGEYYFTQIFIKTQSIGFVKESLEKVETEDEESFSEYVTDCSVCWESDPIFLEDSQEIAF